MHIKDKILPPSIAVNDYRILIKTRLIILLFSIIFLFLSVLIAIKVGAFNLTWGVIIKTISGYGDDTSNLVIWNLRMPRIVASILSGAALSLSGLLFQGLLRNPLASPSTLGISQGAAFGASFSIIVFKSFHLTSLLAFAGGISVTLIIIGLQKIKKLSPSGIVLAGVALSSLFVAATILIQYFADETAVASTIFWTFGDVARSSWREILVLFIITFISAIYSFIKSNSFNALASSDESAFSLGINVNRFRLIGLIIATILAATVTTFHGVIAFLGLLAPHIARKIIGNNYFFLIPCSITLGSILLILADTIGKIIIGGGTLPVGIITSLLGAPLFLYLLLVGRRSC